MDAFAPVSPLFTTADWLALFGHFLMLSLLAVGGALATAPEMHRFLVEQRGWLVDAQFSSSVAIAQAAPGPNLLFVAALGWNLAGPAGAAVTMFGMLLPSSLLTLGISRWAARHRQDLAVRAFIAGMVPLTIGLTFSTGVLVAQPLWPSVGAMVLIALGLACALRTKLSPVWPVMIGAIVGAAGLV